MNIRYFDVHSHLNFSEFDDDRAEVIEEMKEKGIATIAVGTDEGTSRECRALAAKYEHIWATAGVHPTDIPEKGDLSWLRELVKEERVVAVGECGLDYYRDSSRKAEQKKLFEEQIDIALKADLPLMLHGRASAGTMDAYEDMLDILFHYSAELGNRSDKLRGDVHFFAGDMEIAKRFLDLNFSLSFDGPITFSREYDEVIRYIPLDKLMVETDAPFAAPDPYRGKRNSPLYITEIVRAVARIRDEDEEKVREVTLQNALKFFKIKA